MRTVALREGAEDHFAAVASLPEQLRLAGADADAELVAVGGERWVEAAAAALAGGARGVLVSRPAAADPAAIRALDPGDAIVVVESPVLDPTWRAVAPRLREAAPGADLIDGVGTSLLDQLALVRDLGAFEPGAHLRTPEAHALAGTLGDVPVTLAGTPHGRPELRLDLRAHTLHWSVTFDFAALAMPTMAVRYDAGGGELVPTDYETMRRAAWRILAEGGEPAFTLADFADVVSLASAGAAGGPPPSGAGRA
jgi:hypothetical protein